VSFWDDDEVRKAAEGGQYIKLEQVGDTAEGTIAEDPVKRKFPAQQKGDPDRTAVELVFDDGRRFTIGQVLLLRTMFELRPEQGDHVKVVLADVEKRGARTLKLFRVELTRVDGTVEKIDHTS
jgi:hypothetical protein